MIKRLIIFLLVTSTLPVSAQEKALILCLDSCKAMALRSNRHLSISQMKLSQAQNLRKAAKTKYLPKLDLVGGYQYTSKEISILSDAQKSSLVNIGTTTSTQLGSELTPVITSLAQDGILTQDQASHLSTLFNKTGTSLGEALNHTGQRIVDAFDTDTKNIFLATAMIRQPLYMGGSITAANKIAGISEEMARNDIEASTQNTLYDIEQAYWTVVSLKHKKMLADSYLTLVKQLSDDVNKMIKEGVATRADGLKVDVRVNEAEMSQTQVDNGLALAKMYLCQLCGLPLESDITLTDENKEELVTSIADMNADIQVAIDNRPELKLLDNAADISKQSTKIVRAAYLPQVALTAGYTMTNPNVYNGFENKFSGVWSVGVMVRVPVWNWFEGEYKVRSSKISTSIAELELSEAKEKIELQVSSSKFKIKEANRRLSMAERSVKSADENLRTASLGFKEGVMQTTDVMAAQTAWMQAKSQKIDAEINVVLCQVNLKKALGILEN